jgi:hypothetical protein
MDTTVEQLEMLDFPVIEQKAKKRSWLRRYIEATQKHGPLATQGQIAAALGVSRQRINELVNDDRIATVDVGDRTFIPCSAYELFLTEERRVGRPLNDPKLSQILKASFER